MNNSFISQHEFNSTGICMYLYTRDLIFKSPHPNLYYNTFFLKKTKNPSKRPSLHYNLIIIELNSV